MIPTRARRARLAPRPSDPASAPSFDPAPDPPSAPSSARAPASRGLLAALLLACACAGTRSLLSEAPQPLARRGAHSDVLHGVAVRDPYRWLEATSAPEVVAWRDAEAAIARRVLDAAPARAQIRERLLAHSSIESRSVPERYGEWFYWLHGDGELRQPRLVRGRTTERHDEVVLDPNRWSSDGSLTLAGTSFSPHGAFVAYAVAEGGSDWLSWRVLDLASLATLPDKVPKSRFDAPAWSPDEASFYYACPPVESDPLRASTGRTTLFRHVLGTPSEADEVVLDEPAHPRRSFSARVVGDGRWLIVHVGEGAEVRHRVYVRDLSRDDAPIVRLIDDLAASYLPIGGAGTDVWFRTTAGAPNGRIVRIDVSEGARASVEVVAEGRSPIGEACIAGDRIVVERIVDLASRIEVHDLDGRKLADLALSRSGTLLALAGDPRSRAVHFTYTDVATPPEVWRLDLTGHALTRVFGPAATLDADAFATERATAASRDGAQVPVLLTRRREAAPRGDERVLLYGYGGFDVPVRSVYSPFVATWLELGGSYATAHVRGGGELGEAWYSGGIREHKPRAFEDFVAAAERLVELGWTRPSRLAIRGESNGGLLVAAALNERPELFGAAIAASGVYDMLRYHEFTVGWAWAGDYGTALDPALFPVLRSYSPYHNVRDGAPYPPTLLTTAARDERVVPMHSYKLAAALRAAGGGPVLLRVDAGAGHAEARSGEEQLEAALDELCFLTLALGMP